MCVFPFACSITHEVGKQARTRLSLLLFHNVIAIVNDSDCRILTFRSHMHVHKRKGTSRYKEFKCFNSTFESPYGTGFS